MPNIFIASGSPVGNTTLFRCLHLQEQLQQLGYNTLFRDWSSAPTINTAEVLAYDILIFHRLAMTLPLEQLVKTAQSQQKKIVFDTDDLIFEPTLTHWHRGVQRLSSADQKLYHDGVARYLAMLQASDYVLTSTPPLAEFAQRQGKTAFIHRNALGRDMWQVATQHYEQRQARPAQDKVIIGYGSGTPTHDVDFDEVTLALLDVMARHPQVELWLVGPLQLPVALEVVSSRIRRFPLQSWQGWLEIARQFDINLAPLELNNPFCESKSELKFVEAGAVGVPTVASRITPFVDAITPGHDGLLASNHLEWMKALESLISYPKRRQDMGQAARATVAARYTLEPRARDLAPLMAQIIEGYQPLAVEITAMLSEPEVPLVLNWILNEPFKGSGGHTSIFRMIKHLVEFGHECHIYCRPSQMMANYSPYQIEEYVNLHFCQTGAQFHRWNEETDLADATIATHWSTAYDVLKLANPGQRYYFVQDYEPFFFPVGTEYIEAENTYYLGFHCITLGQWLTKLMTERYHAKSHYFDFAVNTDIYWPRPREKQAAPRVSFYARPSTPRRAYDLGVRALQLVKQARPEVEILFYGSDDLPITKLHFTQLGILNEYELAMLHSRCDVGLSLSLTNPSFLPLEMMACRCAVVDIQSERMEGLLFHGENALLAAPTAEAIAEAVLTLLNDKTLRQQLIERGYQQVCDSSWLKSARQIEAILLQHAPAATERVMTRRRTIEQSNTLSQIHHLLAHQTDGQATLAETQAMLQQAIMEKARLAQQVQRVEQKLTHQAPTAMPQYWWQQLVGSTRALLGSHKLYKLFPLTQPLHQSFVVEHSHFCRIELLFAAFSDTNTRAVQFTLREGSAQGPVILSRTIPAADIQVDQPYAIDFEPQPDSFQRPYTFTLTLNDPTLDDGYTMWLLPKPIHPQTTLLYGSQRLPGELAYQIYCQHQQLTRLGHKALNGWQQSLVLHSTWRKKTLQTAMTEATRLSQRAVTIVQQKGSQGLLNEAQQYIKWLRLKRPKT